MVAARAEWPNVPILARTRYVAERAGLLALGANHVVCEELEGGTEMSARVLRTLGLEASDIRQQIGLALTEATVEDLTGATGEWIAAVDEPRQAGSP